MRVVTTACIWMGLTGWSLQPAHADNNVAPAVGAPAAATGGAQAPATTSGSGGSRVAAGIVLGGAAVALGIGTFLAVSNNRSIGGCTAAGCAQESNLVPIGLGLDLAGASLAMVGAFLWFNTPQTTASVALTRSGLVLRGVY
jgi:hypothetical protein